jgi:hypothetical protein
MSKKIEKIVLEENSLPLISDYASLFRYSGMVDVLRDSSKYLYRCNTPSKSASSFAVKQYKMLRENVKLSLRDDMQIELEKVTSDIALTATLDEVYLASAQLSQLLETLHRTPDFLLSLQVREVNANQVTGQLIAAEEKSYNENGALHFGIKQKVGF